MGQLRSIDAGAPELCFKEPNIKARVVSNDHPAPKCCNHVGTHVSKRRGVCKVGHAEAVNVLRTEIASSGLWLRARAEFALDQAPVALATSSSLASSTRTRTSLAPSASTV